jgi:hypothetical protein
VQRLQVGQLHALYDDWRLLHRRQLLAAKLEARVSKARPSIVAGVAYQRYSLQRCRQRVECERWDACGVHILRLHQQQRHLLGCQRAS